MSEKVLGNKKKGLIFVVSAPAGTGKSTLVEMLLNEFPQAVAESISCTTRERRPHEIQGVHYDFIDVPLFQAKIKKGEFLEYASVFGNFYGTRREFVESLQNQGKHVVLVIDTQGAMKVLKEISAISIFISPPSWDELKRRLIHRQTESESVIEERLKWARKEIEMIPRYDYHIVNENLVITYQILRSIFIAEEHKRRTNDVS